MAPPTFRCPHCRTWHVGACYLQRLAKGWEQSKKLPQLQKQVDEQERQNWRIFNGLD